VTVPVRPGTVRAVTPEEQRLGVERAKNEPNPFFRVIPRPGPGNGPASLRRGRHPSRGILVRPITNLDDGLHHDVTVTGSEGKSLFVMPPVGPAITAAARGARAAARQACGDDHDAAATGSLRRLAGET
jgi:hypothetical protein